MIKPLTAGALCLTAAVSIGLYALSYEVQRLEDALAETNAELLKEREMVQVLEAEWSFLNQPDRLRSLGARYLKLFPVEPHQIAILDELPFRPDPEERRDQGPPLPKRKPPVPMAEYGKPKLRSVVAAAMADKGRHQ